MKENTMKENFRPFVFVLLAMALLAGCAKDNYGSNTGLIDSSFSGDKEEAKDHLKELVRDKIISEKEYDNPTNIPVIFRRPYYFREYAVYPDGTDGFEIEFRENDSRITPLFAEVRLNKIRYSTQMYRKYNQAATDTNFLRDTGEETLHFQWQNGRWHQTGAVFNAQNTDELVDGTWEPHHEETVRVNPDAEKRGWFGRAWERIRGER